MKPQDMAALSHEILKLAGTCHAPNWADEYGEEYKNAKPIAQNEWVKAFSLAGILWTELRHLPCPIPGADHRGYPCLTWEREGLPLRRLALDVKTPYMMHYMVDGNPRVEASHNIKGIIEALRAAFPEAN